MAGIEARETPERREDNKVADSADQKMMDEMRARESDTTMTDGSLDQKMPAEFGDFSLVDEEKDQSEGTTREEPFDVDRGGKKPLEPGNGE